MPASRSAAAITRAPRSWPSSPGFPTSTRILRSIVSEPRGGLVGAKLLFQGGRDLADRAVRAHGVADVRLEIPLPRRSGPERPQRLARLLRVALLADLRDPLRGIPGGLRRSRGQLHLRLLVRLADGA